MNKILCSEIRFIDLFCGIGGFRVAAGNVIRKAGLMPRCVFSSDNDQFASETYRANFGDPPSGDIQKYNPLLIPDHDLLFAGFPCQPFSIIGNGKGLRDFRGTLFFDIVRVLRVKKPYAFLFENVKQLKGHNGGKTLRWILEISQSLGYHVDYKVLNALDFGLPQKRERIFIVGFLDSVRFEWPKNRPLSPVLKKILEKDVDSKYYVSKIIRNKRITRHKTSINPSIWHENKSGNISSHPWSCALRAGASHNYLLVNGERRLTPREMLRLQGFPDDFKVVCSYSQIKKQVGNSVPVTVVEDVLEKMLPHFKNKTVQTNSKIKTLI